MFLEVEIVWMNRLVEVSIWKEDRCHQGPNVCKQSNPTGSNLDPHCTRTAFQTENVIKGRPIPVGECHHYIKRSQNQDEMVKWVAVNHLIFLIINQLLPVSILHQVYVTCSVWFPQSCGLWSNIWCWCISGGPRWLDACVENNKKCQDNCYYGIVVNTPQCWCIVHKWIAWFHWIVHQSRPCYKNYIQRNNSWLKKTWSRLALLYFRMNGQSRPNHTKD